MDPSPNLTRVQKKLRQLRDIGARIRGALPFEPSGAMFEGKVDKFFFLRDNGEGQKAGTTRVVFTFAPADFLEFPQIRTNHASNQVSSVTYRRNSQKYRFTVSLSWARLMNQMSYTSARERSRAKAQSLSLSL